MSSTKDKLKAVNRYTPWGMYSGAYQKQKDAGKKAADDLRNLGARGQGYYEGAGTAAGGLYGRAGGLIEGENNERPNYVSDRYQEERGRILPSVTNKTENTLENTRAPITIAQDTQKKLNLTPYAGNQADKRATYGYTPNQLGSRLNTRTADAGGPSSLGSYVTGDLRSRIGSSTNTTNNRYLNRVDMAAQPSDLDQRYATRAATPVSFASTGVRNHVANSDYGMEGRQRGNELRGLTSKFDDMMFDPHETEAIGSLYRDDLSKKGGGYLEKFYDSYDAGNNPSANFARQQLNDTMERASAARGGYVSGLAMRQQGAANAALEANLFEKKGDLAARAQEAQQGRQRDLVSAALGLENTVQGNRNILGTYAKGADEFTLGRERMITDTALAGDKNRLEGDRLQGDLAGREDELGVKSAADIDALAGNTTKEKRLNNEGIDTLATKKDELGLEGTRILTDAEKERARQEEERQKHLDDLTGATADDIFRKDKQADDLAVSAGNEGVNIGNTSINAGIAASNEAGRNRDYIAGLSKYVDDQSRGDRAATEEHEKYVSDLAKGASAEKQTFYKNIVDQAIQLGSAEAATKAIYDKLAGQSFTEAEMAAIEVDLKAAGLDAQMIESLLNNLNAAGSTVVKATSGGK